MKGSHCVNLGALTELPGALSHLRGALWRCVTRWEGRLCRTVMIRSRWPGATPGSWSMKGMLEAEAQAMSSPAVWQCPDGHVVRQPGAELSGLVGGREHFHRASAIVSPLTPIE